MENLTLYVKSKKISVHKSSSLEVHHGQVFGTFSRTVQTMVNYPPEDQEALNLLNQVGADYKLIDLTDCPLIMWLKARISRMKTPTLIWNDRKIVGVENIRQALKDFKT